MASSKKIKYNLLIKKFVDEIKLSEKMRTSFLIFEFPYRSNFTRSFTACDWT